MGLFEKVCRPAKMTLLYVPWHLLFPTPGPKGYIPWITPHP